MPMYANESTAGPKPVLDMDREAEERFVRFVERMPPRKEGLLRLFDRGDYFSAHGPDALFVSSTVFKTPNIIKYIGSSSTPSAASSSSHSGAGTGTGTGTAASRARGLASVTISLPLTKQTLRECLTTKQMRVEIYEPEDAAGGGGRKNHGRWVLAKEASPGNVAQVEDLLFANEDMEGSAVSMALKVKVLEGVRTVGAAFVDSQEKVVGVSEFVDDDGFANTESLLIQLGVKECILPSDDKRVDHELTKLRTLISRCNIIVTERKPADFATRNVEQDLLRLLPESASGVALPEFELKTAMSALSALIITNSLLADIKMHHMYRLQHHDLSQYMKLDASALKALNLMPGPNELGGARNTSLFGLLDKCKTSQGKRLLQRWLKQPLVNLHEIVTRQRVVEAFFDDGATRRQLQEQRLKPIVDFHRLTKRFSRGVATLEDVVKVYLAVQALGDLIADLEGINPRDPRGRALIEDKYLVPLRDHDSKLQTYKDMVQETVDLKSVGGYGHGDYRLLPSLDGDLQRITDDMLAARDELDAEHARVAEELGLEMDKKLHLEKHLVYKYCLRITKAEAGLLRKKGAKDGYYELATQKSGTYFTTTALKAASEDFQKYQEEYKEKQRFLVKEVVGIAASYAPVLETLDDLIAAVDVTVSFAHVAAESPIAYVKPKLTEKGTGDVIVHGARHPCLEVQPDVDFIANDHEMRKDASEFIVLTGPNMGGKSTYIRQLGVIALMAQIGSFVPADEATLPVFDCILARVGAGDSQLKGVSTFMAEMLETATILKSATKDSLIIIDELGRGTSTYDGFGLAWAISEHIASEIRCFCLFATHFHELTTLDQGLAHVKNLHVAALVAGQSEDKVERDITLLYKVKEGICDQSFGIHVAELANFPTSVVKLAKRKAEELEDFGDGSEAVLAKHSKADTDAGTELVRAFLAEWKERVEAAGGAAPAGDDDVVMETGEGDVGEAGSGPGAKAKGTVDQAEQVRILRALAGEYEERFEASAWVKSLLEGF